jgi:uncharacterized membrane protein YraQ (UPF0718 family)
LKLENHIEDWVRELQASALAAEDIQMTWQDRIIYGKDAVREIVGRVWVYVMIGIAVGAGIHGFVPQEFMASIFKGWWRFYGCVRRPHVFQCRRDPVVSAPGKARLGNVLAFMMSVIALSCRRW